ncbi:MAG: hypothetical protein KGL52_01140 [Rhodospirillales bacterium]|nr:hypothetical protein [Rhodospirillales bacterium]
MDQATRTLTTTTASAAPAGLAGDPAGPDAALLALAAAFHVADQCADQCWASRRKARGTAARRLGGQKEAVAEDRLAEVLSALTTTPATTPAGLIAKLRVLGTYSAEAICGSFAADLLASILRDAAAIDAPGLPEQPARVNLRPH